MEEVTKCFQAKDIALREAVEAGNPAFTSGRKQAFCTFYKEVVKTAKTANELYRDWLTSIALLQMSTC